MGSASVWEDIQTNKEGALSFWVLDPRPDPPGKAVGKDRSLRPAWDFHILGDLLGFAAKPEPTVLKTSVLPP